MPISPEVLDEILKLTADQMLSELRIATAEGKALDPRKIKNALDLIERSDARAFRPEEKPQVNQKTGEVVQWSHPLLKDKAGRSKLRKLPHLSLTVVTALQAFDAEDGEVTPQPTTQHRKKEKE